MNFLIENTVIQADNQTALLEAVDNYLRDTHKLSVYDTDDLPLVTIENQEFSIGDDHDFLITKLSGFVKFPQVRPVEGSVVTVLINGQFLEGRGVMLKGSGGAIRVNNTVYTSNHSMYWK